MEDIPQPAREPYDTDDVVSIHLDPSDPDFEFDGRKCQVIDVLEDDLHNETGRGIDRYSYRLRDVDSDETLPVTFRHRDLVPASSQ